MEKSAAKAISTANAFRNATISLGVIVGLLIVVVCSILFKVLKKPICCDWILNEWGPCNLNGQQHRAVACPAGATSFFVNNTVFVDPQFGNNATGIVQSPAQPFATINAAITAAAAAGATAGRIWQIQIRPGSYAESVHLQNFINLLGISSQGFFANASPSEEITLIGTIDDSLITTNTSNANISNLSVSATELPACSFSKGEQITLANCNLLSTFTLSAVARTILTTNGGSGGVALIVRNSTVGLNVSNQTTGYTGSAISVGGTGASLILDVNDGVCPSQYNIHFAPGNRLQKGTNTFNTISLSTSGTVMQTDSTCSITCNRLVKNSRISV